MTKTKLLHCFTGLLVMLLIISCGFFENGKAADDPAQESSPESQSTEEQFTPAALDKTSTPAAATETAAATLPAYYTIVPTRQFTSTLAPLINSTSTSAAATRTPVINQATSVSPTRTPTFEPQTGVTGISFSDVQRRLKDERGFRCETGSSGELQMLNCVYKAMRDADRTTCSVEVYSKDSDSVLFLYGGVLQSNPDNEVAMDYLEYLAALPFENQPALAAEAGGWLADQFATINQGNQDRQATIGGISYRLYGSPDSLFIEMGEPLY